MHNNIAIKFYCANLPFTEKYIKSSQTDIHIISYLSLKAILYSTFLYIFIYKIHCFRHLLIFSDKLFVISHINEKSNL